MERTLAGGGLAVNDAVESGESAVNLRLARQEFWRQNPAMRQALLIGINLVVLAAGPTIRGALGECDLIRTFADDRKPLREFFLAPGGNDSTGDGSRSKPFRTLGRAAQGIKPGDALRLLPGQHAPGTQLRKLAGSAAAPIWIGGVPGEARPVISGGNTALQLSQVRYLIVENLEVAGAKANGINCDDGAEYANSNATRHVIFRNLFLHDIGTGGNNDGLKLSGVNDFFVLDCEFTRMSAGGSGIDHVGCHGGLIARCRFTDAGSNAIQCKGGSEDIEIRSCYFTNGGARAINIGGSTGFAYFRSPLNPGSPNFEARNIRVIANLFHGADAPVAFVGALDSLVAHNTLIEPRRWVLRILQETVSREGHTFRACAQNRFINNLVYFNRSRLSTPVNIGANTDAASFEFANNLWFAVDQPGRSRPDLPASETNGIHGEDPKFLGLSAGDFALATNSPALRRGRSLPEVKADYRGACYANPPAIGAIESVIPK